MEVFFSIAITAYPKIDTANQKFSTDFDLNLRWYDPRLIYRDLKTDEVFNDLSTEDKKFIWSPKLDLPNALGTIPKEFNDDATTVMLSRENEETLPEDFTLDREGMFLRLSFSKPRLFLKRPCLDSSTIFRGKERGHAQKEIFAGTYVQLQPLLLPLRHPSEFFTCGL